GRAGEGDRYRDRTRALRSMTDGRATLRAVDENTKKDIAVGMTNVAAAAAAGAVSGPSMAAAMAGVVALVSTAWSAIAGRDKQRSDRLFERMAEADEDPEDFIAVVNEKLRAGD